MPFKIPVASNVKNPDKKTPRRVPANRRTQNTRSLRQQCVPGDKVGAEKGSPLTVAEMIDGFDSHDVFHGTMIVRMDRFDLGLGVVRADVHGNEINKSLTER